jgi:L-rhamnose mutarotase
MSASFPFDLRDDAMIRKAFVMQCHPDQHAEYERRHRPIWDELAETLRAHGAHNYSIFLHPETSQLFAYVEIEDEARWQAIAQTQVCRRWWAYMGDIMETNADTSPQAVTLPEVFHLE